MSISILLAEKIAQLFLILLMGYLVVRVGLLKPEDSRVLSVIMVYLVMPVHDPERVPDRQHAGGAHRHCVFVCGGRHHAPAVLALTAAAEKAAETGCD